MERTGLRRAQEAVLPLWERTRVFRAYSSWLIPGAVQTSAYTTAVLRAIAARRELPDDVEDAAAVRTDRLRLLREGDLPAGELTVRSTPSGITVQHGHAKGDVALRGPAVRLLLVLVRRLPPDDPSIEVLGDAPALSRWLEHTPF